MWTCAPISLRDAHPPFLDSSQYFYFHRQSLNPFVHSNRTHYVTCIWITRQQSRREDKAVATPELWDNALVEPSEGWGKEFYKTNSRCPDVVGSATMEALWIDGWWTPPSVGIELTGLKQGGNHTDHKKRAVYSQDPGENGSAICLSKLCEERDLNEAFQAMNTVHQQGIRIPATIFFRILQRCIKEKDLAIGRAIHGLIVQIGFESDTLLGSCLIRMFALFEDLAEATQVFGKLSKPNVFSWSAIISAHTKFGQNEEAIGLYQQMQTSSVEPDGHVFVAVLKACSSIASLEYGEQVHTHIIESGLTLDLFIGNTLIDMYAKCGSLQNACLVFYRLSDRDVVTWSALIAGFARHGNGQAALQLFQQMQQEELQPDAVVFVCILKACSNITFLEQGKQIHFYIIECGFESNLFVGNALIDLYAKCGCLRDVQVVFDRLPKQDVITWSALIAGYAQHGHSHETLQLFQEMQQQGMEANQVTFLSILKACSSIAAIEQGRWVHFHIIQNGFESDLFVSNSLIDMYNKCGRLEDAQVLFDRLPKRDVVTWSALITGYAQHGDGQKALEIFHKMQQGKIEPNHVTFVGILKACCSIGALEQGKHSHSQIIRRGFELDSFVGNTLIDMYANCGSLEDAHAIFEVLPKDSVDTWNALIGGYAQHSNYLLALHYFEAMQEVGLRPNDVTFVCLLSACSHVSLIDEARVHFKVMRGRHGILPTIEHYNSMVGLLGNAGCLDEAEDLLETLPLRTDIVGWTSLLGSCRKHGNVDLGRQCFDRFVTMEGRNAIGYVLMSSMYAVAGMQKDAEKVEELRQCANVWKKPAQAFIEIDNQVHAFIVADQAHPRIHDIHAKLEELSTPLREEGYVPCLDLVLDSIPDEDKEDSLCGHCEKLAIAFGLLYTPRGTTIRVTKNLRVCADCHNVARLISKVEMREIVVRDSYCIHHFKDGACSCKDDG